MKEVADTPDRPENAGAKARRWHAPRLVGLAILLRIDYENRVRMRGGRT